MRVWGALSLWVFLAGTARAGDVSSCEPVDLRDKIGAPLHQGDSGYCFAHSSATLISAKLGIRVSPMQLAANYLLATPEELSGPVDPSVRSRITPAFFEMWHRDRSEDVTSYSPEKILSVHGLIETGGDELQTLVAANFFGLCPEERLPTGKDVYPRYAKAIAEFHRRREAHGIPPEERERQLGEVLDPEARTKAWSFRQWVEKRCGTPVMPREPLVPMEITIASNLRQFRALQRLASVHPSQKNLLRAIDVQLSRGNPVAIGYASTDVQPEEPVHSAGDPPSLDKVDHASVLAGRRLVRGKCYYYLRNSYGNDPAGYAPHLRDRYENGGVWVLPDELPSLYSAAWLE